MRMAASMVSTPLSGLLVRRKVREKVKSETIPRGKSL